MSRYLEDVYSQPIQLAESLRYSSGDGFAAILKSASILKNSNTVYVCGIGASWCAGLAIQGAFMEIGFPCILADASELLHHSEVPPESTVILLSRSGKSIEIVQLLRKFRNANAKIISITNNEESLMIEESDVCLLTKVKFDHSISVNTYTSIILTGILLVDTVAGKFPLPGYETLIHNALIQTEAMIPGWEHVLKSSSWVNSSNYFYFLGRGASLASAYESMLLWHEVVKQPASAMSTGSFRHGPQEIIRNPISLALWLDSKNTREFDCILSQDLNREKIDLLILGENIPSYLPGLHIEIPAISSYFKPVIDIIPLQIASSILAEIKDIQPDTFFFCDFVVQKEGGL